MARAAVRGGTARMAATPHYHPENPSFEPGDTRASVELHNRILEERDIPLTLLPGMEVRIGAGLYRTAREERGLEEMSLGEGGRCILVDLPLIDMPLAAQDILFQVQLRGYTPILAHPERNRYLHGHPSLIRELVERGVQVQVNSGSLEGIYGKQARRMARGLLEEGVARLVASDAHTPRSRSPDMTGAVKILGRMLGEEAVRRLLEINPGLALIGEDLLEVGGGQGKSVSIWRGAWRRTT